jgi:hypothetical protein
VKRWLLRFREGDRSCEDRTRARRSVTILGDFFSKFLSEHPFVPAKNIASQVDINVSRVKDLLARELELRHFPRRWVPHSLWEGQKNKQVTQSRLLLDLLKRNQMADFNAIATGDELWFRYMYPESRHFLRPQWNRHIKSDDHNFLLGRGS